MKGCNNTVLVELPVLVRGKRCWLRSDRRERGINDLQFGIATLGVYPISVGQFHCSKSSTIFNWKKSGFFFSFFLFFEICKVPNACWTWVEKRKWSSKEWKSGTMQNSWLCSRTALCLDERKAMLIDNGPKNTQFKLYLNWEEREREREREKQWRRKEWSHAKLIAVLTESWWEERSTCRKVTHLSKALATPNLWLEILCISHIKQTISTFKIINKFSVQKISVFLFVLRWEKYSIQAANKVLSLHYLLLFSVSMRGNTYLLRSDRHERGISDLQFGIATLCVYPISVGQFQRSESSIISIESFLFFFPWDICAQCPMQAGLDSREKWRGKKSRIMD